MPERGERTYRRSWMRDFERSLKDNPDWPVVISMGDSWFSFPDEPNVIDVLDDPEGTGRGDRQRPWTLLRMENGSDEIVAALSSGHRAELRGALEKAPVDALLWSGGGNDLIGADFLPLLKPYRRGAEAADCLDEERLARRLTKLEHAFQDLLDLVFDDGADLTVYVNSYDYPAPSRRPAKLLGSKVPGPWLGPAFRERGYPPGDRLEREVPKLVIDRFCALVDRLADAGDGRICRIETRGAVGDDWADEIHPNGEAARRVAGCFAKALTMRELL